MRLVLASASPRRRELLTTAGFEFDVDPAECDESLLPGEAPDAHVERLARLKAEIVARRHPGRTVLGADTIVVIDGDVLGKPHHAPQAFEMLQRLSGRVHQVLTSVAICRDGVTRSSVERASVTMSTLSDGDIAWYVASGEPLDKAGAYAIQGLGSRFITHLAGTYGTVVGLPIPAVVALLRLTGRGPTMC